MNEFDKVTLMQGLEKLDGIYQKLKPMMAYVVDNTKTMTVTHTGMVELASYHLARASAEIEKLLTDWRILHGKETDNET